MRWSISSRWAIALSFLLACGGHKQIPEELDASNDDVESDAAHPDASDAETARSDSGPDAGNALDAAQDGRAALDGGSDPDGAVERDGAALAGATAACLENLRAQCESQSKCGLYGSVDQCWERFYKSCPDVIFAAGSTRTPEAITACSEAWRKLSCDDLLHEHFPACASPGTRAAGEKCLFNAQCASRFCSNSGSEQCGVCSTLLNKGETCVPGTFERKCGPGLRCDESFKVCAEIPTSFSLLGAACDTHDQCEPPNLCARGADAGYVCSPPPRLGEPCAELGCAQFEDIYCDATSRVCTKTPSANAPCAVQTSSTALACDRASFCDMTLAVPRCRSNPQLGETCTGGCVDAKCSCVDSACSARRCVLFREPGESCDPGSFKVCAEPASHCEGGHCVLISAPQRLFEKACAP